MNIIKNIALVVISPRVGWEEVNRAGDSTDKVMFKAFYPLLLTLAFTSFAPIIYDSLSFSGAVINAIIQVSVYLFGFYIASYLLSGFYPDIVKTAAGHVRLDTFIAYNMMFLMVLNIINNLMPIEFTPIFFLIFYVIWLAIKGVDYLGLKKEKVIKFIIIASALFLSAPILINLISFKE